MDDSLEEANAIIPASKWVAIRGLGEGGGAKVYLCVSRQKIRAFDKFVTRIQALSQAYWAQHEVDKNKDHALAVPGLVESLAAASWDGSSLAAIKIPKAAPSADVRLWREIEAMKSYVDPALIRLLDADDQQPQRWFACEYHPGGTLHDEANRARYRGNPLLALEDAVVVASA